jgi:hypothetical protein
METTVSSLLDMTDADERESATAPKEAIAISSLFRVLRIEVSDYAYSGIMARI